MSRIVVLDNEAVQALQNPAHPKHRRVVSLAQVVASRKRRAATVEVAVPTAVRVEAGWDRTSPEWVFPNRLRIADVPRPGRVPRTRPSGVRTVAIKEAADGQVDSQHPAPSV